MQRETAVHLPAVPANDTRDTPLNRLLRKPSPAPEAPLAPETPVSQPSVTQVTAPESVAAKPQAARISPAEMLVNKLQGKRMPAWSTAVERPATRQAPLPETIVDKPIDVDYTPVEAQAGEPAREADTGVETPVHKPLPMLNTVLGPSAVQPPRTPERAPAVSASEPLPAESTVPEAPVEKPLPAPAPVPEAVVEAPMAMYTAETPVAKPLPTPSPAHDAPVAKPPQGLAPEALFGKPPLGPISAPDEPADKPQRTPGTALQKSIGKLRPARDSAADKSARKLLALPRRTRDEREFLPAALEIVDTPPSPVGRAIGFTIILVAVLAIAWACIGKIDIVATARGSILPQGKTKIVQPADTGIVTAIHVADGDHVKAGDPLIELNSTQVLADRDRFARDLMQARLSLARLRGLAEALPGSSTKRHEPNLVDPPQEAKPEDLALALAAMRAQAANEHAKLADLDQQIQAKEAEAAEAVAGAQKLQASLPMLADQEKLLRDMRDQKIGSKLDWFQINQQLIEQRHEIGVLAHRKDAAEAAQRALREQRAAEAAQFEMSVLADLDKTRALASELEAELAKSEQRTRQNTLLSPIDGTVQQLAIHTIGGVVTPAESLMAIVPAEGGLVVEAMVQNRDVGFIGTGQAVRVKVEAFNFTLYGLIEGKVIGVTRDAVSQPAKDKKSNNGSQTEGDNVASDGNSGPVYLARIALSQDWMMTENGKVDLAPGMTVTAEIQTGQRRLISYLLSPIVRRVSESMHER